MWKRHTVLVSAMLAMGVVVAAAQTRGSSPAKKVAPSLHVDHVVLDVGQVLAGHDIVGTFIFKNSGKQPIRILSAAPS